MAPADAPQAVVTKEKQILASRGIVQGTKYASVRSAGGKKFAFIACAEPYAEICRCACERLGKREDGEDARTCGNCLRIVSRARWRWDRMHIDLWQRLMPWSQGLGA